MSKSKKKKKVLWHRVLILVIGILISLVLILASIGFIAFKVIRSNVESSNILLIGTDNDPAAPDVNRSDTLMVINFNEETSKVTLVSIPRDTYTYIPCVDDYDKINHSYSYGQANLYDSEYGGGTESTIDTVSQLFDIEMDGFVEVNFEELIMLVDDIDGITLTSTATFEQHYDDENGQRHNYSFVEGQEYTMDGKMALSYSRHRKSDSDTARVSRQQEVINAMLNKVKQLDYIDLLVTGNKVLSKLKTNVSLLEMAGYATYINEISIEQIVMQGSDDYIYSEYYGFDLYYFILDDNHFNEIKDLLHFK